MSDYTFARTVGKTPTNTSVTTLYTAPADGQARVIAVHLANRDSVARRCTIAWFDDSANVTFVLASEADMQVRGTIQLEFGKEGLPLDPDDEIRITASAGNVIDAVAVVVEMPGRSG